MILYALESFPNFHVPEQTIKELCHILNPYHIVNMSLILEILMYICWQSDEGVVSVVQAFKTMKLEGIWNTPIDPVFKLLQGQKSVFALARVCSFVNTFIQAHSDDNFCRQMEQALIKFGVPLLYDEILHRIESQQYRIEDCTYERMVEIMMDYRKTYITYPRKEFDICHRLCEDIFISPETKK